MIYWIDLNKFDIKIDKSTYIEICNEISSYGYDLTYVTSYQDEKTIPNYSRYKFKYIYSPSIPLLFRLILVIRIMVYLFKVLKPEDLMIVHPNAMILAILTSIKHCKVHLDVRTIPVDVTTWKTKLDKLIYWDFSIKAFIGRIQSFSFITEALKEAMEHEFGYKFLKNYTIWTSGVNTDLFNITQTSKDERKDKDWVRLFYHGHLSKQRGIITLLEAIAIVVNSGVTKINLTLVGAGADLNRIKEISKTLKVNKFVEFSGLKPYEAIPDLINRADLCISPLPDKQEWNVSSPLKIFEYLACGKPIVCTPIPAHVNVLGDMKGIIYSTGEDKQALAAAIMTACAEIDILILESGNLREFVLNNYTWKIQAENLVKFLKKEQMIH